MKQPNPMEEAYKLLDGEPSIDAVSKAAKGEKPDTDHERREEEHEEKSDRFGKGAQDIDEAYANLFESLSVILRSR